MTILFAIKWYKNNINKQLVGWNRRHSFKNAMSHWYDLLMLNTLRAPVGNIRIWICILFLHVVQSAVRRSALYLKPSAPVPNCRDISGLVPKCLMDTAASAPGRQFQFGTGQQHWTKPWQGLRRMVVLA